MFETALDALPHYFPQLMSQAFSAWKNSPNQKYVYVGILIGPYLTIMSFDQPPLEHLGSQESLKMTDVFPRDCAPDIVTFMQHIFEDPDDCNKDLSMPLLHGFQLVAKTITKIKQGITWETLSPFSFKGASATPNVPDSMKVMP